MNGNFESKAVALATYLLATPGPELQYDVIRTKAADLLATPALAASEPTSLTMTCVNQPQHLEGGVTVFRDNYTPPEHKAGDAPSGQPVTSASVQPICPVCKGHCTEFQTTGQGCSAPASADQAGGRAMTDKLRELANRAYCDYTEQLKRPVCLGVCAKLKDGTFGKAELDAHLRAAELLGRHRAFAEAALAASEPSSAEVGATGRSSRIHIGPAPSGLPVTSASNLRAKLEALRGDCEMMRRVGVQEWPSYFEAKLDEMTAILEGK